MTFPTVNGSNLLREKLTLPDDFQGKFNLIFVPFEQCQQMQVDSWMALAKELEQRFEGLLYSELPPFRAGILSTGCFLMGACGLVSLTQKRVNARSQEEFHSFGSDGCAA